MSGGRRAVSIPSRPWYGDHGFGGQAVLAAVETMILLAAETARRYPDADVRLMQEARFSKFLQVPAGAKRIEALIEWCDQDQRVQALLCSQTVIKTMKRLKEHGRVSFPGKRRAPEANAADPTPPLHPLQRLEAEFIYRELVPFGPAYQSLQDTLLLTENEVWARLQTPAIGFTDDVQQQLGSPFAFDGALQAACVLGQQSVDYAPFPVAFDQRLIVRPTRPGCGYIVRAALIRRLEEELVFDLEILGGDGRLFESAAGVRMRDVSAAGNALFR